MQRTGSEGTVVQHAIPATGQSHASATSAFDDSMLSTRDRVNEAEHHREESRCSFAAADCTWCQQSRSHSPRTHAAAAVETQRQSRGSGASPVRPSRSSAHSFLPVEHVHPPRTFNKIVVNLSGICMVVVNLRGVMNIVNQFNHAHTDSPSDTRATDWGARALADLLR